MSRLKVGLLLFWRNLSKNKFYNSVNMIGLVIGMTCFIFITLYQNYEHSYDNWDAEFKKVYRSGRMFSAEELTISTAPPFGPALKGLSPDVEQMVRVRQAWEDVLLKTASGEFYETNYYKVDSTFFEVFPYTLKYGDKRTALLKRESIVLSEALSKRLFGAVNPIGQTVLVNGERVREVTGVMDTPPGPCNTNFEALVPLQINAQESWGHNNLVTYLKLKQVPSDLKIVEAQLSSDLTRFLKPLLEKDKSGPVNYMMGNDQKAKVFLEALPQVHLHARDGSFKNRAIINRSLSFIAFALIVLVCINFSNLSIALMAGRMRESAIRYVLGQKRSGLMGFQLLETTLQCLAALLISLALAELSLPAFNTLLNVKIQLANHRQLFQLIPFLLLGIVLMVLVSGLYPAVFIAGISRMQLLKGNFSGSRSGIFIRKVLISIQMGITFLFIGGGIITFVQLNYLQRKNLGFNPDNVLIAKLNTEQAVTHYSAIRSQLLQSADVVSVSRANTYPADNEGCSGNTFYYKAQGLPCCYTNVDVSYFETLQIPVVQGRTFKEGNATDSSVAILINETVLKAMQVSVAENEILTQDNYTDSTGKRIPLKIIGVVKDFHRNTFDHEIQPTIYFMNDRTTGEKDKVIIRYKNDRFTEVYTHAERVLRTYNAPFPPKIEDLSRSVAALTQDYNKYGSIFLILSIVSLCISGIGWIALVSYTIHIKAKEISIRKVLGATRESIIFLFQKEYLIYMVLAVGMSFPAVVTGGYYWLQTFVYAASMPYLPVILAALIMVSLMIILVFAQVNRFTRGRPVNWLKYE